MKQLSIFRLLTFILLPFAGIFGLFALLFLLAALVNPAILLAAFLFACIAIYSFTSLSFLQKGIESGRPCKPGLRDWIRVNAYVCVFVGIMFFLNAVSIFISDPATLRSAMTQLIEAQSGAGAGIDVDMFMRILKGMAGFFFFFSILLLVHVFLNFRLMKIYRHVFRAS
ncbi:hypothetical protein [Sediminibacterium ginsengisoli]|uniref:DUF4199 domain-containing protein n=1 Tax=Sediminibacterium ginsengisoli TaxID=413434 RepID=A0A1T4PYK7_9BACT|nr:hypothetical protein [Sediminibacterium ginsengisoli]SJZ96632.1 hypothetical protein SAMN04488132_10741 [Sediminibacterium ginsengisoli]